MNRITTPRLTRITKTAARKLWGKADLSFCPCNLRPDGSFRPNIDIFAKDVETQLFDDTVSNFEWYNCTGKETGNYTAFYLIK